MTKFLSVALIGGALTSASLAQTGVFDYSGVNPNSSVQQFTTSNGFSMVVNGLLSSSPLDQSLSTVALTSSSYNLKAAAEGGLGTGPFSDGELRNGAGTPQLSGASILELSNFSGPKGAPVSDLSLMLTSVDYATHEGFLVYGSTGTAFNNSNPVQLTLLDHGYGNKSDVGSFDINSGLLSKYSSFYVTADNGHYSSVALGNGTKLTTTPEPMSMMGFAIAGIPLLLRRRKKSVA